MKAFRATDVFVVLRKLYVQTGLFRQLITITFQDSFDLLQAKQIFTIGQCAGSIKALGRIFSTEVEQPQANAIGLFGVVLDVKLSTDPGKDIGTDILGPVLQSARCPLMVFLVASGHMGRLCGDTGIALSRMGCDRLLAEVHADQGLANVQFQCFAHILVGD